MGQVGGRANGHGRVQASPVHVDAFAVKNVVVAPHPIERPAHAPADRPETAAAVEPPRDSALQQARERLAAWNGDIHALIGRIERVRYARMIVRMRTLLRDEVPRGAIVAVVSRGDEQLVTVPGRRAWHFPQAGGVYAGHHPADSDAAIAHLEQLRARGVRYLVIPRTAFWWLEHYRGLAEHLDRCSTRVVRDDRTCALFALAASRRKK